MGIKWNSTSPHCVLQNVVNDLEMILYICVTFARVLNK